MTPELRAKGLEKLDHKEMLKIIYDALLAEVGRPRMGYRKKRANADQPMKLSEGLQTVIEWNR